MKKNSISRILSILLVALLITLNSKSQNIDACSLLKESEVESAIGTSVLAPMPQTGKMGDLTYSHCTYKKNSDLVGVLLTVYTYKSKDEVKKLFDSGVKQAGDVEPVSGLGDGAYWWKSKNTLFVIKDKYMASMLLGTDVAGLKAAKSMGEIVVKRIK